MAKVHVTGRVVSPLHLIPEFLYLGKLHASETYHGTIRAEGIDRYTDLDIDTRLPSNVALSPVSDNPTLLRVNIQAPDEEGVFQRSHRNK